jgi:hypothetical protein
LTLSIFSQNELVLGVGSQQIMDLLVIQLQI